MPRIQCGSLTKVWKVISFELIWPEDLTVVRQREGSVSKGLSPSSKILEREWTPSLHEGAHTASEVAFTKSKVSETRKFQLWEWHQGQEVGDERRWIENPPIRWAGAGGRLGLERSVFRSSVRSLGVRLHPLFTLERVWAWSMGKKITSQDVKNGLPRWCWAGEWEKISKYRKECN